MNKNKKSAFINSNGGNSKLREKIWNFCNKHNITLSLFEPGCFDGGIIRYGKVDDGYVVVYDYERTAEALANDYLEFNNSCDNNNKIDDYGFDEAYLDACEWIDYNTIRSIPYMGVGAPKIVFTDEYGNEQAV